jgi:hypothetical protein
MDTTIERAGYDETEQAGVTAPDARTWPPALRLKRRQNPPKPANDDCAVTSHLTGEEPVTQPEIDLVLTFLRDIIPNIMRDGT